MTRLGQCSGMSPEQCRGAEVVERLVWPFASAPFRATGVQGAGQVGGPSTDSKRSDAVQPEDGFIEVVVAVRRGHTCISGDIALEDAHTASGLVFVDVETDGESPDLDRLGSCVRHE